MNDSISTDPRLLAEARNASHAKPQPSLPKVDFDPRAIMRDAFDRIVDKRYFPSTFESVWKTVVNNARQPDQQTPVIGAFTEDEFRQIAESYAYHLHGMALNSASQNARDRSDTLKKATLYKTEDRYDATARNTSIDLAHGVLREGIVESEMQGIAIPVPQELADMLGSLLGGLAKK
jgi:hypothetical protein